MFQGAFPLWFSSDRTSGRHLLSPLPVQPQSYGNAAHSPKADRTVKRSQMNSTTFMDRRSARSSPSAQLRKVLSLPSRAVKRCARELVQHYCGVLCREEFDSQHFRWINERSIEYRFVFKQITNLCPKTILDVGTGSTALPHLMRNCGPIVTAIDNIKDFWPSGMFNRHYFVTNDDITRSNLTCEFDLITCISVLEHVRSFDNAVKEMFRLLRPGGHLILTFPYNEAEYCANVYKLPGSSYGADSPYVCQAYTRRNLLDWVNMGPAHIVEQEYWQMFTGAYWTVGSRAVPPRQAAREELHQLTCLLIQKS